ncbi:formate dehydrogenase accessory protein FdhE [Geobacter hydrogenophilus]|uniref:Formate dehydrogenase accessory protein FdhE n=1 Tax=Geobacter hydrogenophilus TaxID=40983 RepID=A0A9W6FY39_9BACT|nr:formate dehydrogenase accessory protein FdhE [Geobacter hydrogenophilus]MBT0895002.1 formate dehydrogenase accessory protein FdhE [Geobacter hydrogenophilus]GLI37026.1 formate dehydrogenase accessory protein FdhE [Geobacter hydrogenophilus]
MPRAAEKKAFVDTLCRENPEYTEVLAIFSELYAAIEGKEGETGLTVTLPDSPAADCLRDGIPLVSFGAIAVDREKALAFIGTVIDVMQRVGNDGGESLERLRTALAEGEADLLALLRGVLDHERRVILETALAIRIDPGLVEFAFHTPLRVALERVAEGVDPALYAGWNKHFCPVCGSPAAMAELVGEEGERHLSCSTCFSRWTYNQPNCPFCDNDDPEQLTHFTTGEGPHRVDICLACSQYLKTRLSPTGSAGVPPELDDLATVLLDLLAAQEGYRRGR